MAKEDKTPKQIKLDEKNHVEDPFLDQLDGLEWEIIRLGTKQNPSESYRETFTEVVLGSVLRESLQKINSWLESDQVEARTKRLLKKEIKELDPFELKQQIETRLRRVFELNRRLATVQESTLSVSSQRQPPPVALGNVFP